jgi:hypothetical protein
VINAANGAGVTNALLQLGSGSAEPQAQFSGENGRFVFTDLPRGTYQLAVTKPGFFNEQQLARTFAGSDAVENVPGDANRTVKLTPEGIIYGRVEDANGKPIEGLLVRAKRWRVTNGVKQLESVAGARTDDEGQFRIFDLQPRAYDVNFFPGNNTGYLFFGRLRRKPAEQAYGSQFERRARFTGSTTTLFSSSSPMSNGGALEKTRLRRQERRPVG